MVISKKKLLTVSSLILAILVFVLFGTPCYRYTSSITGGTYYLGYDFGFGGNIINLMKKQLAPLILFLGLLLLFLVFVAYVLNTLTKVIIQQTQLSLF